MTTPIADEFKGVSLGDPRLSRRAVALVERAAQAPAMSFPDMMPTGAELEAAYRFFQNDYVTPEKLLAPHVNATLRRARAHKTVTIASDTVALSYGGTRKGLGALSAGGCGYYAHVSLAIGADEERAPLGVVGVVSKAYPTNAEKALRAGLPEKTYWRGTAKWGATPLKIRKRLEGVHAVHVMDREADNYALYKLFIERQVAFVVRGDSDRLMPRGHVQDALNAAPILLNRRVRLEARPKPSPSMKAREERDALLSVRASPVEIRGNKKTYGQTLKLNAVEVVELRPPRGQEAVQWTLYTNEPINTPEAVASVVDHYRRRWVIEELFKALKTGCAIERRQLTDFDALRRALALFIPIAWQLLALRTVARAPNPVPANRVMTATQLLVLDALLGERRKTLPSSPTASDALLGVAALGGHLRRNGDPGWITLGRGMEDLRAAEAVWALAQKHALKTLGRSDQS